jgi:hypothetical protein
MYLIILTFRIGVYLSFSFLSARVRIFRSDVPRTNKKYSEIIRIIFLRKLKRKKEEKK